MSLRAAVFASGRGSNFRVLADHAAADQSGLPESARWRVTLLVSDRHDAGALDLAGDRGIDARVIPVGGSDPDTVAGATLEVLRDARIDLVLLAGYLRLVPAPVVEAFRGRMLNLHPALLPSFGGKGMYGRHVHQAVLDAGVRVTGATVHFVDERYDRGPILAQWPVPVLEDDSPEALARRVTEVEHRLYPAAVDQLARALTAGSAPVPIPGDAPGGSPVEPAGSGPHFFLGEGSPG